MSLVANAVRGWLFVVLMLGFPLVLHAQASPPLTLYEVLDNASYFYPSLRAARFDARASAEDTSAVRLDLVRERPGFRFAHPERRAN